MTIAVYGGTFDPPHRGHQLVAHTLLSHQLAEEVWFVPVWQHPLGKSVHETQHRLAMLELLINDDPRLKVETYEIEKGGVSYTYETMVTLTQRQPQHRFVFVMGSDNLMNFHQWYRYRDLLALAEIMVYPRAGYPLEPLYPRMTVLSDVPVVATSSTMVRETVAAKKSIAELVDPRIERYIKAHSLYVTAAG